MSKNSQHVLHDNYMASVVHELITYSTAVCLLIKMVKASILGLFQILEKKSSVFHYYLLCELYGFCKCSSSIWRSFFLFLVPFIVNGCWCLSNTLSIFIEMIIGIFLYSIHNVDEIDFLMFKQVYNLVFIHLFLISPARD